MAGWSAVIIGDETLVIRCSESLLNAGIELRGIISESPMIIDWAHTQGLRVLSPAADLEQTLRQTPFDFLFSIANLRVIPPAILALPTQAAINFHDGPLPAYRGVFTPNWALANGETRYGITWHEMVAAVDAGDIYQQRFFDLAPDETASTLNAKCADAAAEAFADLVRDIVAGTLRGTPQPPDPGTTYRFTARPPFVVALSWHMTAAQLDAAVRATSYGGYPNPFGTVKIVGDTGPVILSQVTVTHTASKQPPGTIVRRLEDTVQVATADRDVILRDLKSLRGHKFTATALVDRLGLVEGDRLPALHDDDCRDLIQHTQRLIRHEAYWLALLRQRAVLEVPYADHTTTPDASRAHRASAQLMPTGLQAHLARFETETDQQDAVTAALALYLGRLGDTDHYQLGWQGAETREAAGRHTAFVADHVPLQCDVPQATAHVGEALAHLHDQLSATRQRRSFLNDIFARYPDLETVHDDEVLFPVLVQVGPANALAVLAGTELALQVDVERGEIVWQYHPDVYSDAAIAAMQAQFEVFSNALFDMPNALVHAVPLLPDDERHRVLHAWNDTAAPVPADMCIHHLFEAQVATTPDAVAVVYEDATLTYAELNTRANQLARYLQRLGVQPDELIGIYMEPSLNLMVGIYAILKAGAAYVPLDPAYPADRIAYMIDDADAPIILTQSHLVAQLPAHNSQVVPVDGQWARIAREPGDNLAAGAAPHNLAYVIYTSGSTGKPKGVMVEHRNVVNFFVGMDERIASDRPESWLSVTSLSFDISVLELFWTLARGFRVVLFAEHRGHASNQGTTQVAREAGNMAFSLFYFASDESENPQDRYRLLLEGARFADENGFAAVWTPERHFHKFGGLYPNPAVTSAAVAAITRNVRIRAGSLVAPLHHPVRIAEEWALVDNLSNGRVDISFAAGWQPNDFVLMPENFADRKQVMFDSIEQVQTLWQGGALTLDGPDGRPVEVTTLPRPIQPKLPVWVTTAGNPETFRMAGERGQNILTHLLGQSIDDLAEKIAAYREAYAASGHAGRGHISLMLHTFVGDDIEAVREVVREPMKTYLKSSVGLIKQAAWSFPTFQKKAAASGQSPLDIFESEEISEEDMDALLEHSFNRYFETSGLFGTPASCVELVGQLAAVGVDEIACLIDFGVPTQQALAHLDHLNQLREHIQADADGGDYSFEAQMQRHNITYLQCTPSFARLLTDSATMRAALQPLKKMMVGGEAFPPELAVKLEALVGGDVLNMYGPTETTIWSSTYTLQGETGAISIGTPIANTAIYILDRHQQPVPAGVAGELVIGGLGVVRGYRGRPDLTAERFLPDPFAGGEARMYRTGDLARWGADGKLEFLGRLDHQVKIRGYRIELGEIEAALLTHPSVKQAVVNAYVDGNGHKQLAAYYIPKPGQKDNAAALRAHLQASLPEFMVPASYTRMERFALTPNGKIDRKKLPVPDAASTVTATAGHVAPRTPVEKTLATIWADALGVDRIGIHDNFFDLGGHSLLAMAIFVQVEKKFGQRLPLATLFRSPTIAQMAGLLDPEMDNAGVHEAVHDVVVPIQTNGSQLPIFCVGGGVINLNNLATRLGSDQPFYALQWAGLGTDHILDISLEEVANRYIEAMKSVQPEGPYQLAASFSAGVIVVEMARQLQAQGEAVTRLMGFDTVVLNAEMRSAPLPGVKKVKASLPVRALRTLARGPQEVWRYVTDPFYVDMLRHQMWKVLVTTYQNMGRPIPMWLRSGIYEEFFILRVTNAFKPQDTFKGNFDLYLTPALYEKYRDYDRYGWGKLVSGEVQVHPTPGAPCTIMLDPNVDHLATTLRSQLEEAPSLAVRV